MPNVKISAATDAGTLLASDMLPLARSGDTSAYHATMAEIATYASTTVSSGAYGNIGRNVLHNGQFLIQQRGPGTWSTNGAYTADRWQLNFNLDAAPTVNIVTFPDAIRAQIGDESARCGLQNNFAGNAGAASYTMIVQKIEDVRRLSGKTVTLSFWANCASGTPGLGMSLDQQFGSGGSPSAPVLGTGVAVTLSTTMTRYSHTFTLPSTAGMTLGTNNDHYTEVNFWFSSGTTQASRAGNIGVQTGNVSLWGVQLEVGAAATPLEKMDYTIQLAECERFYQTFATVVIGGYQVAGGTIFHTLLLTPTMRVAPFVTYSGASNANCTGPTISTVTFAEVAQYITATATGGCSSEFTVTAAADL